MNPQVDDWISGYLDESLEEGEMAALGEWIQADPENARHFARAAMLHDRLHNEWAALEVGEREEKVVAFPRRKWLAAAAASVAAVFGFWQWRTGDRGGDLFVTISRVEKGSDWRVGERRGLGLMKIESEVIRMLFDSGVEVTVEGPAEFELRGVDLMVLQSGVLAANVPPGAEGFRVDTPTAQITDLGTAFGVSLDPDGSSRVSVFDGEIEIEEPTSGERKRLTEGEEARINASNQWESVAFDAAPYERVWPVSSGIAGSTGSFRLAPPWPRRLALFTSDEQIFVVPDGYRKELESPLKVNISAPGEVRLLEQLSPSVIPTGVPVRSFLLHFRPEEAAPRRFAHRLSGTITFDRPIVGLIVLYEEFVDSAGRFSSRKAGEGRPGRELELNGSSQSDRLELSEDRRSLTVDLSASLKGFDLIRVVVDASASDAENVPQ